jgi:uncharacterized protein (DUF433 family)
MNRLDKLNRLRRTIEEGEATAASWDDCDLSGPPLSEPEIETMIDILLDSDFSTAYVSERIGEWRRHWAEVYFPFVTVDREVMGGIPVFRGTRVPVGVLFDNLADGMSLDGILSEYETLNRADVEAVLEIQSERSVSGSE